MVVLGAVLVGLLAAGVISWTGRSLKSGKPDSPIEWNAVQAVPTRAPDVEDVAWERRAEGQDGPVLVSGQSVQVVRGAGQEAGQESAHSSGQAVYVIDGDTFSIDNRRVRIAGIDAPETHPSRCTEEDRLGRAATDRLRSLLSRGTITMSGSGHDQYGRELRNVSVNGNDVGEAMISAGLARSYAGGARQPWCN